MCLNGGVEAHGKAKRVVVVHQLERAVSRSTQWSVSVVIEERHNLVSIRKRISKATSGNALARAGHRNSGQAQCSVLHSAGIDNHPFVARVSAKFASNNVS